MKNVQAIIVTYNPSQDLLVNVEMLLPQVDQLFIIDNASKNRIYLEKIEGLQKVTVLYNEDNKGIACALNQGVRLALESGCDWIATFDQDSRTAPGYIQAMLSNWEACTENTEKVGMLAPRLVEMGAEASFHLAQDDDPYRLMKTAFTSGALVKTEVFSEVGYFREDYFIDYVDHEFCLRLRKYGYTILRLGRVNLFHHLGNSTKHQFLFFKTDYTVTHHSPTRRYTIARNRIITYKLYLLQEPKWIAADAICWLQEMVKIISWEEEKGLKLLRTFQGVWDGLVGHPVRKYLYSVGNDKMMSKLKAK